MGNRIEHQRYNFETIGSDSEMIEKVFIDRNDLIKKHTRYHREFGGHDAKTRDLLFATFGQRGVDEFDSHCELDDWDYTTVTMDSTPQTFSRLVKSVVL